MLLFPITFLTVRPASDSKMPYGEVLGVCLKQPTALGLQSPQSGK